MILTPDSVVLDDTGLLIVRIGAATITRRLVRQEINALQRELRRSGTADMVGALEDSVTLVLAEKAVMGVV